MIATRAVEGWKLLRLLSDLGVVITKRHEIDGIYVNDMKGRRKERSRSSNKDGDKETGYGGSCSECSVVERRKSWQRRKFVFDPEERIPSQVFLVVRRGGMLCCLSKRYESLRIFRQLLAEGQEYKVKPYVSRYRVLKIAHWRRLSPD